MALYTTKELRQRSGGTKARELDLPDGITKKIWIPREAFLYRRVHFKINQFTTFKHPKYNTLDCLNQNPGEKGRGCPVCDEVQQKWAAWKDADKAKDAVLKKAIQNEINQLVSEYYYCNAIDLEDPEKKFFAVRFTSSKMKDVERVIEKYPVDGVIWYYKMIKKGVKTEYSLMENTDSAATTAKLLEQLEELESRDTASGGPIDLEASYIRHQTKEGYLSLLEGGEGEEGEHNEEPPSHPPTKKAEPRKPTTPKVEVDEEESLSLDEVSTEDLEVPFDGGKAATTKPAEPKKAEPVKTTPKESDEIKLDDDPLANDDLDKIEFASLDDEPVKPEPPKVRKFSADEIKTKLNDKEFQKVLKKVYAFLVKEKKLEATADLKAQLVNTYRYVAKEKTLDVPESDLK